nr:hypothetical protein [Tanacetum cinerariifolium]
MHGDCQRFNGIYKHLNRKSEESDADLVENVKTVYIDRYDNLQELFGPDPRERPADKQRAKKKQKSVETISAGGSTGESTGGSQSKSVSSLVSQDYRRKCDTAEKHNLQELFGSDPRERPADKQRAKKKQKSVETISAGESTGESTGGSQSKSVSSLVSQDYRRKCD